jgi:hypothetical protein
VFKVGDFVKIKVENYIAPIFFNPPRDGHGVPLDEVKNYIGEVQKHQTSDYILVWFPTLQATRVFIGKNLRDANEDYYKNR